MQQLVRGVHYFQNIGYQQHKKLFERLKDSQSPEACFITCADSRIDPNLITHSQPGQLFIVRNVGNVIPCYGTSNNGELAAVEFAVMELGIEDIIVCGHSSCGAMKAVVSQMSQQAPTRTPSVMNWLRHADATLQILREHYGHLKGDALVKAAAEENVLVQLEHLRTLPVIAARIASGKVRLHGWMYKIDTGDIFHYDSDEGQFVKFGGPDSESSQMQGAEKELLTSVRRGRLLAGTRSVRGPAAKSRKEGAR